jgi:hypothetical protein
MFCKAGLDGPLPKLCPAVALSHQDGRHSAVALLLNAALIQVSDYRLLGASRWFLCEFPIGSYVKLSTAVQPSWSEGGTTRHNFGRGPSNDYFIKVWFQLSNWFFTEMILGWSPSKIISGISDLRPRWPPQPNLI